MGVLGDHPGLACAVAAALALVLAARPFRRREGAPSFRARLRALAAAEDGAAAAEFALAAPVLLALVLLAAQLALVAVARRAVEEAAFAAARSAVVWVPEPSGEGPNRLRRAGDSEKRERIERAAALALLPVAPAEDPSPEPPAKSGSRGAAAPAEPEVVELLRALARETGIAPPGEVARRYAAARARLRVEVRGVDESGAGSDLVAGPDDPLTVTAVYTCPLVVPLVARLLGSRDRRTGSFRAELAARCTMRNEGTTESDLVIGE